MMVLLAALVGTPALAQETYAVGCVDSELSVSFSILERSRPERPLYRNRASLDTRCTGAVDGHGSELLRLVLSDLCQVLGVDATSCLDVVRGDLGPMESLIELPPLSAVSVALEGEQTRLDIRFGDARRRVLAASLQPDGGFEAREDLVLPDLAGGGVLECSATGDLSARGHFRLDEARVEVGRSRTFLCLTGAEELVVKLEIVTVQNAGDVR